jgi:transcriptional regulator with XRE-family HTH domain
MYLADNLTFLRRRIGLSQDRLSKVLGMNRVNIGEWETGTVPNSRALDKLSRFFDISVSELLYTDIKSEQDIMFVDRHFMPQKAFAAAEYNEWQGLPMYNMPIAASLAETSPEEHSASPLYYFRDPQFRDCDFGAIITGDSMQTEIRHGDFVVCKEVTNKDFIVYGEIYYIVAKNGLETCKYIDAGGDDESVLLVPRNEKVKASPMKKDMIERLYKVRGIVRGY